MISCGNVLWSFPPEICGLNVIAGSARLDKRAHWPSNEGMLEEKADEVIAALWMNLRPPTSTCFLNVSLDCCCCVKEIIQLSLAQNPIKTHRTCFLTHLIYQNSSPELLVLPA